MQPWAILSPDWTGKKFLVERPERETIAKLDYFAWTDIYVAVIIQGTSLHGNSNLAFRLEGVFDVRLRPFPLDIKLYCPRERERVNRLLVANRRTFKKQSVDYNSEYRCKLAHEQSVARTRKPLESSRRERINRGSSLAGK